MELGNMMFGNSRGEAEVPRSEEWGEPLRELFKAANLDECCGYPNYESEFYGFDNDVFTVRPYDWDAECDCGHEELVEKWCADNMHSDNCYYTVLTKAMQEYDEESGWNKIDREYKTPMHTEEIEGGVFITIGGKDFDSKERSAWGIAYDKRQAFDEQLRERLCSERGLSFPECSSVHCDCGRDKMLDGFLEKNQHKNDCRLIRPNFLYKPTGFRINWYKYPLRDSYMTPGISLEEWVMMIEHCKSSVANKS